MKMNRDLLRAALSKVTHFIKRFSKELLIAVAFGIIATILIECYQEGSKDAILRKDSKATATIECYGERGELISSGSGFFISPDGLLVTNYHVIDGAKGRILARLSSRAFFMLKEIKGANKDYDLAVLQFDASETPYVKLGESDKVRIGEKVFAIGSPMGLENSISEGIISHLPRKMKEGVELIQFTASISSGSSGGGLFNGKGRAIGVTSESINISPEEAITQNLNFAVPTKYVNNLLAGKEVALTNESPDYFYSKGILARNKNDDDSAVEYFKKAISMNDKYVDAYIDLGNIYSDKRQYDQEIVMFTKAAELDPGNSDAYYSLAASYEDTGQYDSAITAYEKVINLKPDDYDAIYELGVLYIMEGEKDKAAELIPRLTKLNSGLGKELETIIDRMK